MDKREEVVKLGGWKIERKIGGKKEGKVWLYGAERESAQGFGGWEEVKGGND